jgi:hypothetical protein
MSYTELKNKTQQSSEEECNSSSSTLTLEWRMSCSVVGISVFGVSVVGVEVGLSEVINEVGGLVIGSAGASVVGELVWTVGGSI